GSSVGMAMPLLYIPITVVGSLAFVMIPTVSTGISKGHTKHVNAQVESSIGFSVIIASLFVPMFFALGEPIGRFVYDNADAGRFITASAWLLVPLSVENITSSVMNSLDLELKSFINYLIGSAVMFAILFAFYGNFNIIILSIGMGTGWTVTCALHILSIRKKTGLGFSYMGKLVKSVLLTIPTVFVTKCVFSLLSGLALFWSIAVSLLISLAFYAALAFVFGLIDVDFFKTGVKTSAKRKQKTKQEAKKGQIAC
ncbi:MAG: polysaccharide biosynthesis C-terminal domain-containing protein, partial [Christensenellales bacterium]